MNYLALIEGRFQLSRVDMIYRVMSSPESISISEATALASRFKTSVSTIRRIQRSGLNPRDVGDVAKWILGKRQTSPAMTEAVAQELQQLEEPE